MYEATLKDALSSNGLQFRSMFMERPSRARLLTPNRLRQQGLTSYFYCYQKPCVSNKPLSQVQRTKITRFSPDSRNTRNAIMQLKKLVQTS